MFVLIKGNIINKLLMYIKNPPKWEKKGCLFRIKISKSQTVFLSFYKEKYNILMIKHYYKKTSTFLMNKIQSIYLIFKSIQV